MSLSENITYLLVALGIVGNIVSDVYYCFHLTETKLCFFKVYRILQQIICMLIVCVSPVSDSESEDESVEDRLEKAETDTDADSKHSKPDTKSQKAEETKPKSPQKTAQKSPPRKEEKQEISDFSDYDSDVESFIKDLKQKKSEMKEKAKAKNEAKSEPGRETPSKKSDQPSGEPMEVDATKKATPAKTTPAKSPAVKATKQAAKMTITKVEKVADSPQSEPKDEAMDVDEDVSDDISDKNKDAQSDDGILKDLRENHDVDMGDLLIDLDSEILMPSTSKLKCKKDNGKGKRRKSTDSTDKTMRQDSIDTVAYSFDIQNAVQNILDQLDEGSDISDDLPFLPKETKEVLKIEAEKRDEPKTEKLKKEKKTVAEKPKNEKAKGKAKKVEKVEKAAAPEEVKPELELEKEKKPESEKKKIKKKKKVKKKGDEKAEIPGVVLTPQDDPDKESKPDNVEPQPSKEPTVLNVSAVELQASMPPALVEVPEITSVVPAPGDKEEGSGLALSPAPPTLQAVRPHVSEAEEDERPAPPMEALSPAPLPAVVDIAAPVLSSPQPPVPQLPMMEPPSLCESAVGPPVILPGVVTTPTASTSTTPVAPPAASPAPPTTVLDNTPPDTPEGSPVAPALCDVPTSPTHAVLYVASSSVVGSVVKAESEPEPANIKEPQTMRETSTLLLPGGESPNTCDTSTISNGSDGSSGNVPSSEDSTEGSNLTTAVKRKQPSDEPPQHGKKRKRVSKRSGNTEKGKVMPKNTSRSCCSHMLHLVLM